MRRCRIVAAVVGLGGAASAQSVDTLLFKPAAGAGDLLTVQRSNVDAPLAAGVWVGVANDPLVEARDGARQADVVDDQLVIEPVFAVGLWRRLEIGAAVPLVAAQSSEGAPALVGGAGGFAVGDLRLAPKVRIGRAGPVGLGASAALTIPTAGADTVGERTVTATPRAIADVEVGRVALAANLGVRARGASDLPGDLQTATDFVFGAGAQAGVRGGFAAIGEIYGAASGRDRRSSPVEALGGARWRHGSGLAATLAAGGGIVHGVGAADLRVVLALTFAATEAPPPVAPPPPVAAPAPALEPEPDLDADRDGILLADDACPALTEDRDGHEDADGCPDPDNDLDGVIDAEDRCPNEAETVNGYQDDDGCPDQVKVVVQVEKIEIGEPIFFETARDVIAAESFAILDQVAAALAAHPEVRRLRIEGHTDDRGDVAYNLDLSRRRAAAVRRYIVEQGVAAGRLDARGFGESRPVRKGTSEGARALNRRVEFIIVERAP